MKKSITVLLVLALLAMAVLTACNNNPDPTTDPAPTDPDPRSISVTVSDGSPVQGATVSIRSMDYTATTDEQGKCCLALSAEDSAAESYTLVVRKEGYIEKTVKVSAGEFTDNSASVEISISSEEVTISGKVTCGEQGVEGVLVSISCDATTVLTDENGEYTVSISRPLEQFTLTFEKELYGTKTFVVEEVSGSSLTVDMAIDQNSFAVSGTVKHYFDGAVEGVTVTVSGTQWSTKTDAKGAFNLEDLAVALPYELVLSKSGYQTKTVLVSEENATVSVELVDNPIDLGVLSPENKQYSMQTVRDSAGIYFYFTSKQQFLDGDKICIYIDVNETGNVTSGSSVLEFALLGNDTAEDALCLLWNLKTGKSVADDAVINWGDEVKYTLENSKNGAKITAFISYDTFAKAGKDFAITQKSVVGISFFDRSANASGAAGWDRTDLPGIDGAAWVHPDNPKDFVRLAPENVIYQGSDNTYIPYGTYKVTINVKDSNGNPLSSTIKVTAPTESTFTAKNGTGTYVLPALYFNGEPTFLITADGYLPGTKTVVRSDFSGKVAKITVVLEKAPTYLTGSGKVVDYKGGLEGVTVGIQGYTETVLTDAEGRYDLSALNIRMDGSAEYTLVFTKEGYDAKTLKITAGAAIEDVCLKNSARNLGVFGQYQWDVTIDRDDTKLIIDLSSSKNWYGTKDLNGAATVTENELQIYFVTNLTAKTKTAEGLRELTIVEKASAGGTDWAGWRDGNRNFLDWPGIVYTVENSDAGCKVHVEVSYELLGIGKNDTIGLAIGEWYGIDGGLWSAPFYDGQTQSFITTGWCVNINDPSTSLHWAADNSTKVEYIP